MKKKLEIGIGSLEESVQRFVKTWHTIERGQALEHHEVLTFDNLETLLRVLTPTRWNLLQILRKQGPISVRLLARELGRDYKNVHTDVGELERVGLVSRSSEGQVVVPWDTVVAQISLDAA